MITVEISTALLIYMGCFLLLCFGPWFFSHFKQRHKETLPPLYRLCICEYCAYPFLATAGEKISKCPQCHSFNKKIESK